VQVSRTSSVRRLSQNCPGHVLSTGKRDPRSSSNTRFRAAAGICSPARPGVVGGSVIVRAVRRAQASGAWLNTKQHPSEPLDIARRVRP